MEWISGNIFIRPNVLAKAGDVTDGHTHNFDHTTIVYKGAIHVKASLPDGTVIERDFGEGQPNGRHCLIRADVLHEITALVDDTEYWCVYSHREPQGEISLVNTGWPDAYV
jgi:quercetin dioxygenase-like cupin family protein